MGSNWRAWQLFGMATWMIGSMLGCADDPSFDLTGPGRTVLASKAPSASPTAPGPAVTAVTPSPKWTLPAPTPTPTQAPFRTPIPHESVEVPDPTPTPDERWEPPVDDPTPEP